MTVSNFVEFRDSWTVYFIQFHGDVISRILPKSAKSAKFSSRQNFVGFRWYWIKLHFNDTACKMKFSINDFFSKCDQIEVLDGVMKNFIFCAVQDIHLTPWCSWRQMNMLWMSSLVHVSTEKSCQRCIYELIKHLWRSFFVKTVDSYQVLANRSSHRRCSIKKLFRNIHRKTRMLESLFNKVAGLKAHMI